jgi:hypothetical protein
MKRITDMGATMSQQAESLALPFQALAFLHRPTLPVPGGRSAK